MRPRCPFPLSLALIPAVALVALPVPAQTHEVTVSVPTGVLGPADGGTVKSEALELPAELPAAFRAAGRMGRVSVLHFPVAPGVRDSLELTPFDVYAPGTKIWSQNGQGTEEVPRSRRFHFLGRSAADPELRVGLSVDPESGALRGWAVTREGLFELVEPPTPGGSYLVRREGEGLAQETSFSCASSELPGSQTLLDDPFAGIEPPAGAVATRNRGVDPLY